MTHYESVMAKLTHCWGHRYMDIPLPRSGFGSCDLRGAFAEICMFYSTELAFCMAPGFWPAWNTYINLWNQSFCPVAQSNFISCLCPIGPPWHVYSCRSIHHYYIVRPNAKISISAAPKPCTCVLHFNNAIIPSHKYNLASALCSRGYIMIFLYHTYYQLQYSDSIAITVSNKNWSK